MWNNLIIRNMIVIIVVTIATFGINILIHKINKKSLNELALKDYMNMLWKSLLLGYIIAVLNITLFSRIGTGEEGYNLLPFKGIEKMINDYLISYGTWLGIQIDFMVGNILMFVPFGFLGPKVYRKINTGYKMLGTSVGFILFVELVQAITKAGNFDIDDVIYNVLGSFLGYSIYLIWEGIFTKEKNRVKLLVKGIVPFCVIALAIGAIKIIHGFMPYGILPNFVLYKGAESSAVVESVLELDDSGFYDTVCKVNYDVEDIYVKNVEENIFKYLELDYTRYYGDEEADGDVYLSRNGAYRLEVYENGGFRLRNVANYAQYEKENEENDEYGNGNIVDINNNYVNKVKEYTLELLKCSGVNLEDKEVYEELYEYPSVGLSFSGYDYNGRKIVKRAGADCTKSGEIAEVYCSFSTYDKTSDKIKIISEKEAFDKILKGEAGFTVDGKVNILSFGLNWFDRSSKGYNFPVYEFQMINDRNDLDSVISWYIPAWEFVE